MLGVNAPGEPGLVDLLDLAVEAAMRAAEIHRDARGALLRVSEKSSSSDLVTQVDREAEAAIVEAITAARPDDAILAEEGGGRSGESGVRWIVDPLDGTANYVYGYPAHAVSIGVEIDGVLSVGVVHDTSCGSLYTATLGGQASRDGAPIESSGPMDPSTAMVATGFSYDPELRRQQGRTLAALLPQVRDARRSGSASLDLCAVACGTVDAYYEAGVAPWDVAGGIVIARAAGAEVLFGTARGFPGLAVLTGSPSLVPALALLLQEAGLRIEPRQHVA